MYNDNPIWCAKIAEIQLWSATVIGRRNAICEQNCIFRPEMVLLL
jgi:hypothetical protein